MQDTQIELLADISVDCGPVAASAAAVHPNRYTFSILYILYCMYNGYSITLNKANAFVYGVH